MSFEIITDSSANLSVEIIEKYHLHIISLILRDGEKSSYSVENGRPIDPVPYYRRMRDENAAFTTSCINVAEALEQIEPLVRAGSDVLYLGFSSGLSATSHNVLMALDELRGRYPERKIMGCDTLAAAMGEGLLVTLAARKRESGASIEETCAWVEENKLHSCHWFTVESLKYLRRGGRISATSAVVGSLLDIKPVLHVDDEGHLIAMDKVRGMRAAVKSLIAHMRETWNGDPDSPVFINHADSPERAQELAERVRSEFGVREIVIEPLDLVIGSHSGPGTLALFFMGSKR